jgi:hypothetical protein
LNLRPTELIPPSSPVRFADLCNGKKRSSTEDVSSEEQEPPSFGISPGVESPVKSDCFNYVDGKVKPDHIGIIVLWLRHDIDARTA